MVHVSTRDVFQVRDACDWGSRAAMCSHALSDDVTLRTKKEIRIIFKNHLCSVKNQKKSVQKFQTILAPPRINSSQESNFPILVPERTLNVEISKLALNAGD